MLTTPLSLMLHHMPYMLPYAMMHLRAYLLALYLDASLPAIPRSTPRVTYLRGEITWSFREVSPRTPHALLNVGRRHPLPTLMACLVGVRPHLAA